MADRGLMTKEKSSFIGKSFNRIKKMQYKLIIAMKIRL